MEQDWEKIGRDIQEKVQEAVDSRNYSSLNQTVSNVIDTAMDAISGIGTGFQDAGDAVSRKMKSRQEQLSLRRRRAELFTGTAGMKIGGTAMAALGWGFGAVMFFLLLFLLASGIFKGAAGTAIASRGIVLGVLMAGGFALAKAGTSLRGAVKRFRTYVAELGTKEYCEIPRLAEKLGKKPKYVVKDLEKMIGRGWFKQGRLDGQKTCLIASDKAFGQYMELMRHVEEQRREKEQVAIRQQEMDQRMDPQVREILQRGDDYIRKIHQCNDAIPGEEISGKISRMEILVDRIFDRVEEDPSLVPDIRRLMEYYLPTTVKLLEAYEDLDRQPVQGENIRNSKNEIEKTLDTLNEAFTKLLDDMFQETAWDVSSDISVLNTMLAQEGLSGRDFKIN